MIRRTIPRPPGREDWLTARFPYVGASEVPVVLGLSPYRTAGDLAAEKLHGIRQPQNAAMDRGNRLEPVVAQWWADEHGTTVDEVSVLHVIHSDEDEPVLLATLDRTIAAFPNGALEVKTTRDYIDRELPEHWQWQCQAQALCAGLSHIEVAVLDGSMQFKSFTVKADYAAQTLLYERSLAFMRAIRCGEFPPDVDVTYETAQLLHPKPTTTDIVLDNGAAVLVRTLRMLLARKASLERDESILKARIARRLGDATDGYIDGKLAVTWRPLTRHDVDTKALRRDHPDIAREYARESTSRRMLLK